MDMQFFTAEIDPHITIIDLHSTTTIQAAIDQFEQEIARASLANVPYVRVIHGIGTGILKHTLESIFKTHPLVVDYKRDTHGGSTIVLL